MSLINHNISMLYLLILIFNITYLLICYNKRMDIDYVNVPIQNNSKPSFLNRLFSVKKLSVVHKSFPVVSDFKIYFLKFTRKFLTKNCITTCDMGGIYHPNIVRNINLELMTHILDILYYIEIFLFLPEIILFNNLYISRDKNEYR